MALSDLQAFLQQVLLQYDPTTDVSSGSPADVQIIQPILRRIGPDPFSVDMGLFIQTALNQAFPEMPTQEGDAVTDLLIKPAVILFNPITREITRIARAQSFEDPTTLTTDEADALGANLFAVRDTGDFSTGSVRLYFAQSQNCTVSTANYCTSNTGLHFFPTEVQSIRAQEMQLNTEDGLYYFDVDLVAEAAGDAYNISPSSLVSIANLSGAVRITNKLRFRNGADAEDAPTFVGNLGQALTEKSLTTQRGIVSTLSNSFPDITQLNTVGFNDPPMERDVLTGGGLGPIIASGFLAFAEPDGEDAILTRRLTTTEAVDFTTLVNPVGVAPQGFTVTLHGAFPLGSFPAVRDIPVQSVIDPQTLDLQDQVLSYTAQNIPWVLRQSTLTLSNIPGGILFPNQPDGTLVLPNNQIHVGGCYDVFVRGSTFDEATLILSSISDDSPTLSGLSAVFSSPNLSVLSDLTLGSTYAIGDGTYLFLASAATTNVALQVLNGPNAGTYRVLEVLQSLGSSPIVVVTPAPPAPGADAESWKMSSSLYIDLIEPKNTKVSGVDLRTVQGSNIVDTIGGTDFDTFGVSLGDTLRIETGTLVLGDYVVQSVLSPFFTQIQVDRNLPGSVTGAKYTIFTPNPAGGIQTPFVRIEQIDLLDSSNQPVGTTVPYGAPIDAETQGFANSAHGIKSDILDAVLGIVTLALPTGGAVVGGLTLTIGWPAAPPVYSGGVTIDVSFSSPGGTLALGDIINQINTQALAVTSSTLAPVQRLAVLLPDEQHIGILPVSPGVTVTGGTAVPVLFGFAGATPSARGITSSTVDATGGWAALRPVLDPTYDVAQVLNGSQIGFYGGLQLSNNPYNPAAYDQLLTGYDFNPAVSTHVQVGARSLGTARVYFLDPTSFEVDGNSNFAVTQADGSILNYTPDTTNNYQRIPALPAGTKPLDGETGTGGSIPLQTLQSISTDFIQEGILPGDLLVIDYVPIVGVIAQTDPAPNMNNRTMTISLGGAPDKVITFLQDSTAIPAGAVTRQGLINQINQAVGQTIVSLNSVNQLVFNPTVSLVIRAPNPPSHPNSANGALGFTVTTGMDQNNESPNAGTYVVAQAGGPSGSNPNQLYLQTAFPSPITDIPLQQFSVYRAGLQRIGSTTMSTNTDTGGLYYFDVDLLSEGTGDQYNLPAGIPMVVTGYRADGYTLTTQDPNLTFSPAEEPILHISRTMLQVGVNDDPTNATQLTGQNIQLTYDMSSLANDVNNFLTADTERTINASPLGRHLIPYFVRFTLTYAGGSNTSVTTPAVQTLIQNIPPDQPLESSAIQGALLTAGATVVDNPLTLIAVIHNFDRSITVERSEDSLNTGTLAAFVPDQLLITQRTS